MSFIITKKLETRLKESIREKLNELTYDEPLKLKEGEKFLKRSNRQVRRFIQECKNPVNYIDSKPMFL